MIVDCHTHLDCAAGDVEASEHLAAAETVDVCIVLAGASDSREEANRRLSEYVTQHKEKMVGFAVVEPTKDRTSIKNVRNISDRLGLKGAVLYCSSYGFHPAHSRAMR
ncbi:MAG: amidohydrolase family protein, partial [Planctomycetota bacterium]